jgi:L-asparagine transporter-like permease
MPRWLSIVTFIVALGFLLFAEKVKEARFIFPVWVFVVSVYILIVNYRRSHEEEENHGRN